jgi:type IV secretory pathway VirD2 relaxase
LRPLQDLPKLREKLLPTSICPPEGLLLSGPEARLLHAQTCPRARWSEREGYDGSDLVISRNYISHGLRSRTEDLVSAELGPRPEHEIRSSLERDVDAERWTRLDAAIKMAADDIGLIDLRPDQPGIDDPEVRRLAIGRLQKLERMSLATAAGPGRWMVDLAIEPTLHDLGVRSDIIKTMHRAFTERG